MTAPTILLLAGEESGDRHGAGVAAALRERWPDLRLVGLGGPRMEARGVELLAGLDELAVMGFVEVLSRLPFFWRLERRIVSRLDGGEIDLVLPIDYPGLNLRISRAAYRRGIPVLYYIAPQVWAWKAGRARKLAEYADRVAVILPFEEALLREAGARVRFVGHPLTERDEPVAEREELLGGLGLDPAGPVLALFPGSRRQELDRHLDLFVEAAARVVRDRPEIQPVLAAASPELVERLEGAGLPVTTDGRSLLRHARAALVKSGTSTLEAALAGTPFVTVYRTHPLTYLLARRLVRVDRIALANLVAGREVVPEVLQGQATPERLASEVLPFLDPDEPRREVVVRGLAAVRELLEGGDASREVAEMTLEILAERGRIPPGPGGPEREVEA